MFFLREILKSTVTKKVIVRLFNLSEENFWKEAASEYFQLP